MDNLNLIASLRPTRIPTVTLSHLAHLTHPPMLVNDLLPESSITLIAGPTYSGKTFFAMELARAVAFGQPFMSHFRVGALGHVLFIEQDSPEYDTGRAFFALIRKDYERLRRTYALGDSLMDLLHIAFHPGLNLKNQLDIQSIIYTANILFSPDGTDPETGEPIGLRGAKLIVLDTFRSLHTAEENNSTEMEVIMQRIKDIRKATKAAILLIHHGPKNPQDYMGIRGSTAIEAAVDTVFRITSSKKTGLSTATVVKGRAIRPPDFHFQIRTENHPTFGLTKEVIFAGLKQQEQDETPSLDDITLLNYITEQANGATQEMLDKWAVLNEKSPRTIRRWADNLIEQKKLRKEKENGRIRYFPLDTPPPQD